MTFSKYRPFSEEEFGAEMTPASPRKIIPLKQKNQEENQVKSTLGIIGIMLSGLSLFILPYLLAPIGILLGFLSYRRGNYSLGLWAMGLGVIGLLGTMIVTAVLS